MAESDSDSEHSENIKTNTYEILERKNTIDNLCGVEDLSSSGAEQDTAPMVKLKKRVNRFSDSDSGNEPSIEDKNLNIVNSPVNSNVDINSDKETNLKKYTQTSRIRHFSTSDSDSDSQSKDKKLTQKIAMKNKEQQIRIKNKRDNLKQKFKSLITSRDKNGSQLDEKNNHESSEDNHSEICDNSDDGISVIAIKKKINQTAIQSICDPDTSDEENNIKKEKQNKKIRKSTKPTSPKPVQMSAKQAMENMQKIKSESNRMLREKEVSLPYHKPKALSLKDIMSRRKPAVTADGKALPIKMNEEQLRQYAIILEERQKEMMQLCKSDTDEEETPLPLPQVEQSSNSDKTSELLMANKAIENEKQNIEKEEIDLQISNVQLPASNIVCIDTNIDEQNSNSKKERKINYLVGNLNTKKTSENDLSIEETKVHNAALDHTIAVIIDKDASDILNKNDIAIAGNQSDSQLVSLYYDSEKMHNNKENSKHLEACESINKENGDIFLNKEESNSFEDYDINMEEIDSIIENAEIIKDNSKHKENFKSPMLIKDTQELNIKPKLTGAPGMIIDLDGSDPSAPKLTGVDILKERFKYFANIKTADELEREKEKSFKPGYQYTKLKQELEEKLAEQRSYEWAKRLEEEKMQQMELKVIRGETSDAEDEIDKIETKLAEKESKETEEKLTSTDEEEDEEDFVDEVDKPRKRNPLITDEAEESDADDEYSDKEENNQNNIEHVNDNNANDDEESEDESSEEEYSSESEDESQRKSKKGRILKAFEDSDEEDTKKSLEEKGKIDDSINKIIHGNNVNCSLLENENLEMNTQNSKTTQDDELQLAQVHKSLSEDLFTSQESDLIAFNENRHNKNNTNSDGTLCSQTFSILNSNANHHNNMDLNASNKLNVICNTQPDDGDLDAVVGMCSGSFSQNLVCSQPMKSQTQPQGIDDDVLALCTGQFYDNQFVSNVEDRNKIVDYISEKQSSMEIPELVNDNDKEISKKGNSNTSEIGNQNEKKTDISYGNNSKTIDMDGEIKSDEGNILKSILNELDDPEFDTPTSNKYLSGNYTENKENIQLKKRLVIDSEDEADKTVSIDENIKEKKLKKKKKLEMRALQISDDEEDDSNENEEMYRSDLDDDAEKIVDYDSEENEIVIKPQDIKKKRKATDFFEQEAELTSEDEWVGSGDEDEVGLDRMEREEGDDEIFHQGKLQQELGKIHMREILDQDKREVRLIQETLLEDDDLGTGHRQRKFRWRNADGEEETGTVPDEFADTQEEEFESEEQWRIQRHEREVFLRQMQKEDESEKCMNISINRTTIIKANLSSKTMSSLLMEANPSKLEQAGTPATEKKPANDIPSPKKPFTMYQMNYHGSLLSRSRGVLARLGALATPLAADGDDVTNVSSLAPTKNNFVFATVTPDDDQPKVTKRKADISNIGTPRLVKKMKLEEKQKIHRRSLLDHLKT